MMEAKDVPNEQVLTRMKCILDMVTLENFDLLVVQLESGITTPEILVAVVTMIFYKAISQPILCPIYAQLCADLNEKLPPFPPENDGERTITLRRILLNKCQEVFEGSDNMWSQIRKLIDPEQEMDHRDEESIVKLWYLGNIRFVCELWKEKIMTDTIIHRIIRVFLGLDMKACSIQTNVEAICLLFNKIGKQLDENPMSRHIIDAYFNELNDFTANPLLTSQLTFMVRNIIDLRTNWSIEREKAKDVPNEQVLTRMKCILDMVTLENFDLLVVQLESDITTPETLVAVVTMIFYKAISQPILCPIYAQLCADLNEKLPPFPPENDGERTITLRRILLNKCQEAFEGTDNMSSQIRKLIGPEQEMDHRDKESIVKLWYLGNIRFVCELWKENIMPNTIIHHIIRVFLGLDMKACSIQTNVEAICLLFNKIGKQLDENPMSRHIIDAYFNELKDLTANPLLTSQLTFMVRNIIDLRTNNWSIQREKTQVVQFDDATYRAIQIQKALTDLKEYNEQHSGRHHVPFDSNAFYFALTSTLLLCIVCFILGILIGKRL